MEQYNNGRCPPAPIFRPRYVQLSGLMSALASRSALLISRQNGSNAVETVHRLNDATENFNFASEWAEDVWSGVCSAGDPTCGDGMTRENVERVFSYFDRAERKIRAYLEVVEELLAAPTLIAANAFRMKSVEEGIDEIPDVPAPPPRRTASTSSSSTTTTTTTTTRASGSLTLWIGAGLIGLGTYAVVRLNARAERKRSSQRRR